MSFTQAVHQKAIEIGKLSVEMTTVAGSGHPTTALSLAHLTTVLMYHQMRWDPKNPWDQVSDRLILSEGHAVPIVYAAMADLGVALGKNPKEARPMTRQDALELRAIQSPIDGHPNPGLGVHFFDAATGSLGQGLSVAAGVAAAAKIDGKDRIAYCIIGDGEAREGQIWEAMDFIADHALVNCVPIFNCNELAQSDWVSAQQSSETLARKAEAYGFIVRTINGHDPEEIRSVFSELHVIRNGSRPLAIIARTVKGWGSLSEQGTGKHGTPVKQEKLQAVLSDLDQTAKDLNATNITVGNFLKIPSPPAKPAPVSNGPIKIDFAAGMEAAGLFKGYQEGKAVAPRRAYGAALLALAQADKRVIGLDADVKNSTFAEYLFKKLPGQFLECRIAEQNMFSVAAGAAAAGKIPFCSTFAKFVVRGYDQIEMAINSGANFKITGSHAGVTLAADGPSQMSLPDAAFFRSFCHTKNYAGDTAVHYFFPADAVSCFKITELMANINGCCYQRTLRADTKALYKPTDTFEVGGYKVLREGKDLVLVAAGYMVHECLAAADLLAKAGKSATVIDAYAMPLQTQGVLEIAAKHGGIIVTAEDNYAGGLDAELATAIANTGAGIKLLNLFVRQIPKSGHTPEDVLHYLHLDAAAIADAASKVKR
ncbi:MAG: transketolase [Phycisphaerales bacterium]|nr:transketolase [Phycisphaerales bacterium]